ncbi:CAP domain-containing protein [Cochlodiniinecator piscidefendens]|uniref:CAP domain-containing protein n=1 Tax=Cochlodiniinecator piscidefendens TaxID=2715756 RepID=UPI0014075B73|nr:CAP domain-containing protein [Cochlodiniinecator piscidefendens]
MHKMFTTCLAMLLVVGCVSAPTTTEVSNAVVESGQPADDLLFALLNQERSRRGLALLNRNARLETAAQNHASDMAERGYFSHTSPNGQTSVDRVRAQGYSYCRTTENIGQGQPTAATILAGWMGSSGHRANNLDTRVDDVGVGVAANNNWVLVFGREGC